MKIIIISLSILLGTMYSQAQTIPKNKNGEFEYKQVIKIDSITGNEIYDAAKKWILSTLKSSDNMIQLDDSEKKQIIGNGTLSLKPRSVGFLRMANCMINFKIIIDIKNGRYRYTINNFQHYYQQDGITPLNSDLRDIKTNNWGGKPLKKETQDEIRKEVNTKILMLIENMKVAILNKNNDDW